MDRWEIRLTANTTTVEGKQRSINMILPDAEKETIKSAVMNRRNPFDFYGDTLTLTTPLHHTEYTIDPDTRELICLS